MRPGGRGGWKNSTPDAQCQGSHTFEYAFMPRTKTWSEDIAEINRATESILLPIRSSRRKLASNDLPSQLEISNPALVLSSFKPAEDGKGLIVRLYNPSSLAQSGTLRWPLPAQVSECNLEEKELKILSNTPITSLELSVEAYKITTLRLKSEYNL
jgi:alpha-mannosidase